MHTLLRCRPWLHRSLLGGMLLFCMAPAPLPAANPPQRPALELRKLLNFLLEGSTLPSSTDALSRIIAEGLRRRISLPADSTPVMIMGGAFPNLDQLNIDFSHARISSGEPVPRLRPLGPSELTIRARELHVIADPMSIDGAAMYLKLNAQDVALGVQRDRLKNPILVLSSARQGDVQLHTTAGDLGRIFRASANYRGKKYGLSVEKAVLKLSSSNEHQLLADLRMSSTLVLLPIQLHFTARVDVDDQGMARLSNLTCDGSDLAGWLISGMIQPSLAKYDGKTMPLVTFPSEDIKLRAVSVKLDGDDVRVGAAFGT